MTLNLILESKNMDLFITKLCKERGLSESEVAEEWKTFNETYTSLNKLKKPELLEKCKEAGYSTIGAKGELIKNIIFKVEKVEKPAKAEKVKKASPKPFDKSVLSKMTSSLMNVVIRRNKHGNYEHPDTHFVFNSKTREVIGKQEENGDVVELTKEDIVECNRLNFKYVVPFNLGSVDDTEEVVVEEEELVEEELVEEEEDSEEEIEYDEV